MLIAAGACVLAGAPAVRARQLATAPAASGGVGLGGTAPVVAERANLTVSATGNGITLATGESALEHQAVQFTGSAPATDAGDLIEIERTGAPPGSAWVATAQAVIAAGGSFATSWRASQSGLLSIRAALIPQTNPGAVAAKSSNASTGGSNASTGGSNASTGASSASTGGSTASTGGSSAPTPSGGVGIASSALTMSVYQPAVATWYGGPTMFGHHTACGEMLLRSTLGVANRTLPCGTLVQFYYAGHSIVVPVIDRGPYSAGVSWDLTEATAIALGTYEPGRATVGTIAPAKGAAPAAAATASLRSR
ncbi:MAG: septal ring lytic transglycosylase RlpA family protein [Solirubrobacteraceae bacterium]